MSLHQVRIFGMINSFFKGKLYYQFTKKNKKKTAKWEGNFGDERHSHQSKHSVIRRAYNLSRNARKPDFVAYE